MYHSPGKLNTKFLKPGLTGPCLCDSFRAKQENLEPKVPEVLRVTEDWKDKKEHRVTKVRSALLLSSSVIRTECLPHWSKVKH